LKRPTSFISSSGVSVSNETCHSQWRVPPPEGRTVLAAAQRRPRGIVGQVVSIRPLQVARAGALHAIDGAGGAVDTGGAAMHLKFVVAVTHADVHLAIQAKRVPGEQRRQRTPWFEVAVRERAHQREM
jgi:hypothetical protein